MSRTKSLFSQIFSWSFKEMVRKSIHIPYTHFPESKDKNFWIIPKRIHLYSLLQSKYGKE
jgi:hypothetical protein